ncbi:MAG TPA: DUF4013 domain-containing protein [Candidatus Melainabacteria bacterium]|nr:DUF4013 domain-containing protein [Candidatus Melainabacteria bacterium]
MTKLNNMKSALDPDIAARAFFRDPQWLFKTGIGGFLNVLSFILCALNYLLIPVAFLLWGLVTGYVLRAARMHIKNPTEKLPDWNDWVDLLISGLTWMAIYTGQLIFFFSVFSTLMLVGLSTGMVSANNPSNLAWSFGSLYGLLALAFVMGLNSAYLMINLAHEEQLAGAFAVNVVISKVMARPADFILAWLIAVGIQMAAFILPAITVVGLFFLPSIWFAGQVLSALVLAHAWTLVPSEAKVTA